MPIEAFWDLNEQINRVRAEEILDWMPAFSIGMGGEHVPRIVSDFQNRVGRPTIVEAVVISDKDKAKLRNLFGANKP